MIVYYLNSKSRTYSSANIIFTSGTQLCKDKFLRHRSRTTVLLLDKHLFKNKIVGLRHLMMSVSVEPKPQNLGSRAEFQACFSFSCLFFFFFYLSHYLHI